MTRLHSERGAALLTALILMGALSAIATVHALNVRASLRLRGATAERRVGYYAAEGGLNVGMTRFANIFRDGHTPQAGDFNQSFTLDDHEVSMTLSTVSGCDPCAPTRIPIGEVFAGLNTLPYRYTVHSESERNTGDTAAHVAGEFDIHNIPIFQFLAFIDSHLFVMPLKDMELHGRLHTNGNLYIQPDALLEIEDLPGVISNVQVTSVGDIFRGGRKYDASWRCWGDAFIDKNEDVVAPLGDLDPLELKCATTSALPDSTLDNWLGTINSGVNNIVTPSVDIFDRLTGSYWQSADLRIVLRVDTPLNPGINFADGDLCPTGPAPGPTAGLHLIEVQNLSGAQDVAKTRQLWRFMCEKRGALFYTDVPAPAPIPPTNAVAGAGQYAPPFNPGNVYRRVGEDTSGDGVINATDSNEEICPTGGAASPAPPWSIPAYCPAWPNNPTTTVTPNRWYQDMDYRRGGFWNHREQQWMYLLNLNLRALIEWNQINGDVLYPHGDESDGGLVLFMSVQGPLSNGMNNYGIRVFDSADLDTTNAVFAPGAADPTGVSVVSDQAAIVQGNFNTVDKFPAAVMADAVHILSQGWEVPSAVTVPPTDNDLKSVFLLSSDVRNVPAQDFPGTGTFNGPNDLGINAAFLFGLGPSTLDDDWYNGGLENFARTLESWENRTLNYLGSYVSLGPAQHKLNNWACGSGDSCNIYEPPTRLFDYDTDFDMVENLPPMTPRFVYLQQRMYTRFYD